MGESGPENLGLYLEDTGGRARGSQLIKCGGFCKQLYVEIQLQTTQFTPFKVCNSVAFEHSSTGCDHHNVDFRTFSLPPEDNPCPSVIILRPPSPSAPRVSTNSLSVSVDLPVLDISYN